MYKIVTKEDTIRIPAEYMRKGQSLDQHIDRLSMTAFEGRFDDDNRRVGHQQPPTIGKRENNSRRWSNLSKSSFDAVLFCMDDYEVVEGVVSEVNEFEPSLELVLWRHYFTSLRSWKTQLMQMLEWVGLKESKPVED